MTRMRSFLPLPRPLPGTLAVALCGLFAAPVLAAPTSQVVTIDGQPTGALTGKSVVVDPGHGLFFHDTYGWIYQRDPINGLHEDKHTNEIVMDWLRPHLEGAGARVLATRAPHRQTVNVIVDNADPGYSETGTFTTTTNTGLGYRGSYRYATTSRLAATATATWSATLPQRGDYPVWVYYYAGADRSPRASFTVRHAGGTTRVRINQQLDRQRWIYIGTYPFVPTQPAAVTLDNFDPGAKAGEEPVIIADAVRFGVGMGDFLHDGKPSGEARWVEESFYYMVDHGAPETVYKTRMVERDSGLVSRPLYADWEGADAFVSVHTNAADRPNVGSGMTSYIHDTMPSAGSDKLQSAVHAELLRTNRTLYVKDFSDRGKLSANFAVVREIKTMPAMLLELAFHDTEMPDAMLLRSVGYRRDIGRAIYKGLLRYLNPGATVTPLPPTLTEVTHLGGGALRVRFQPEADPLEPNATAAWYRLFVMRGATGFGSPVEVRGATEYVMSGFAPGEVVSFHVRAVNDGGESLPSAALSVTVDSLPVDPPPPPPSGDMPDLAAAASPSPEGVGGCSAAAGYPNRGAGLLFLAAAGALGSLVQRRRRWSGAK